MSDRPRRPRRWPQAARLTACVAAALALAGCAVAPPAEPADPALWADARFAPPREPPDAEAALALSPAMREHVAQVLRPLARRDGAALTVGRALTRQGALRVEYDSSRTRTAAEAFEARSGNCLSLVLLAAALAEALEVEVDFREVLVDSPWSRVAGLFVASGHVNLSLGPRLPRPVQGWRAQQRWIVDFLPSEDLVDQPVRHLERRRILALYLNNRAAEWLVQGDLDTAHAWARAALEQDPGTVPAYNTLAVVYLRHGEPAAAERALQAGLRLAPEHPPLLANLAQALRQQGRETEAAGVAQRLARAERSTPFADYARGMTALRAGDAAEARRWFLQELARDPDYHEFHFALALAEWRLGHPLVALAHLERAGERSTRPDLRTLYSAKAEHLRSVMPP